MKNSIFIIVLSLLLMNCKSEAIEKPDNLVDEDKMVAVMYDLYLLNAIKSTNMNYLRENNITSNNYIFKKYNIDSLQFSQSDLYYASDVEAYEKMYQRVTQQLQSNKAAIDSLIASTKDSKNVKSIETRGNIEIPAKRRDSLRKGSFIKRKAIIDSIHN